MDSILIPLLAIVVGAGLGAFAGSRYRAARMEGAGRLQALRAIV